MNALEFRVLADENIRPEVVAYIRQNGGDVVTVAEAEMLGADDVDILHYAAVEKRIVLTHDRDFGQLAIQTGVSFVGIIYLRPGHIKPSVTIDCIAALLASSPAVKPPFVLVIDRRTEGVRIRLRNAMTDSTD